MQIVTKFLWLQSPVVLGDQIDGWQVCWVGGWDPVPGLLRRHGGERVRCRPAFTPELKSVNK
jgi:hypothetical protein